MLLQIPDVLTPAGLTAIQDALSDPTVWRDGAETAAGRARDVKRNLQASDGAGVKGALAYVEKAVGGHAVVKAAAQPDRFARILFNRYDAGMKYGDHVDAAYIDGVRTDLSFTLFLSDPDSYDGGALVIDSAGAEDRVRLPAGALVLYPSTSVHRIEPVTRGTRLAAVGWIRSCVRDPQARAVLFELERLQTNLAAGPSGDALDRLANVRNNLLRIFGD